ncbi:hypothetical protein CDAR_120141 [Caerostris darwini]|uniref:Uncharacterized protein n=1 Tax=Caerostris darwini TaxID=1538125 RepID=A0AAV4UPZ9_9ARAC|nr:hypothetical protein CDAR_120141 [Caerostris darwini]
MLIHNSVITTILQTDPAIEVESPSSGYVQVITCRHNYMNKSTGHTNIKQSTTNLDIAHCDITLALPLTLGYLDIITLRFLPVWLCSSYHSRHNYMNKSTGHTNIKQSTTNLDIAHCDITLALPLTLGYLDIITLRFLPVCQAKAESRLWSECDLDAADEGCDTMYQWLQRDTWL